LRSYEQLESDSWDFSQSNRLSLTRIQNKQLEYLKISFVRKEREAASIGKFKEGGGHRLADAGIVRLGRLWNQKQQRYCCSFYSNPFPWLDL
jgi:hypothetical protein